MEKELIIKLRLDRSQAATANQQYVADAKAAEKKILDDAAAAERARAELVKQANKEKVKSFVDAANAAKMATARAAKEAAEAQKQAYREAAREAIRAAKDATAEQKQATREALAAQKQAAREAAAEARRLAREAAEAQKQATREAASAAKDLARQQSGVSRQAAAEAKKVAAAHHETNSEIELGAKALGSFAAQTIGLNSVAAVIGIITDHFKQAQTAAYDAGKMVQDYRLALLELAALKGQLGGTTKTLGQEVNFRSQTLQSAADAQAFQKAALGMGQASIGNQISQDEFNKAMAQGGAFQAAEGGSATTHGQLVGMIPTLMSRSLNGRQMTAEEVRRKEAQFYAISQPGGTDFGPMMDQFLKNSQLSTTGLITPERNLALQSAFSTTNREGAGNMVQQFTRATVGGLNRMRGMPGVPGEENEKLAMYLRGLGANDQMDPIEIGKMISADLSKQESSATAKGEKFNALSYLQRHGQANMEDAQAMLAFHGLQTSGQLDKTFLPLAEKVPTAAEANAPVEKFQRTDPAAQARKAEMATDLANISIGAGKQEYLMNLEKVAHARLKARGEVSGEFSEGLMNRWDLDPREIMFPERRQMEMEAQKMLESEAKRLGIDFVSGTTVTRSGKHTVDRFLGQENLYKLGAKINAAGGSSIPGLEELTRSAGTALGEAGRFEGLPLMPGLPGGAPMGGAGPDKINEAADKIAEAARAMERAATAAGRKPTPPVPAPIPNKPPPAP